MHSFGTIQWKQKFSLCTQAPDSFDYEDLLLLTDLKATETEKEKKAKQAKLEEVEEIKLTEEKSKEEAKSLEKKSQEPKGIYTCKSTKYYNIQNMKCITTDTATS